MKLEIYPWQTQQWQQFLATSKAGRLPHALLISGPDGIGMEHFSLCLAAHLLCRDKTKAHACGSCKSCVLFSADNHPDMFKLEPEETGKQIKVDNVRGLIDFIHLSSQYAAHKIAVINPAEAMNRNAANALLKTLEEPPPDVIFLLVSPQPAILPVTIRSRCQAILFSRVGSGIGVGWLSERTGKNEVDALELLNLAEGRPLLAMEISNSNVAAHQDQVLADLERLAGGPSDVTAIAHQWHDFGTADVFRWLLGFFARMAKMKSLDLDLGDDSSQLNRDLQRIGNPLHLSQLVDCHDVVMGHYRVVTGPFNLNRIGLLEDFIIYWQSQN